MLKEEAEVKRDEEQAEIWGFLFDLVDLLGADGMSSDESDLDDDGVTEIGKVKIMPWRVPRTVDFMEMIDRYRKHPETRSLKGNKGMNRVRSERHNISRRPHVEGLPLALYKDAWRTIQPVSIQNRLQSVQTRWKWLDINIQPA